MIKGLADNAVYLVQVSAQVMTRDDSTGGWVPVGGGGLSKVRLCKLTSTSSPLEGGGGGGGGGGSSSSGGNNNNNNNNGNRQQQQQQQMSDNYPARPEYVIHGQRVADNAVILDCPLKKDIQYTKANPKWHHWKTDDKRYGLTFERSEDAKAFDQGIRVAVADLTGGLDDGIETSDAQDGMFSYMPLKLTRNDSSSRSASTTSTTTSSPGTNSPQSPNNDQFNFANPHGHLHRVHYMSSQRVMPRNSHTSVGSLGHQHQVPPLPQQTGSPISEKSSQLRSSFDSSSGQDEVWVRPILHPSSISGRSEQELIECDSGDRKHKDLYKEESYVVFNKSTAVALHEYSYPNLEPTQKPPAQRSSTRTQTSSSPSQSSQNYPPLPIKNKAKSKSSSISSGDGGKHGQSGARSRLVSQVQCKHCREVFSLDDNPRGACEDAPDSVERCIECFSCVSCTQCLMYHCWADADGEFRHPCSCDSNDPKLCKRWTALTFLSLLLPCLWCYLPLKACHRCGIMCGLCGGRHKAA